MVIAFRFQSELVRLAFFQFRSVAVNNNSVLIKLELGFGTSSAANPLQKTKRRRRRRQRTAATTHIVFSEKSKKNKLVLHCTLDLEGQKEREQSRVNGDSIKNGLALSARPARQPRLVDCAATQRADICRVRDTITVQGKAFSMTVSSTLHVCLPACLQTLNPPTREKRGAVKHRQ